LLHADKCNGNDNNTGDGVANSLVGDEVGDGKGDKGNCHQRHCCHHRCPHPLSQQPLFLLLMPPQLPNAIALSAAIAAAVDITHLFGTAIKRQWRGQ
jgi:hypothetical protein